MIAVGNGYGISSIFTSPTGLQLQYRRLEGNEQLEGSITLAEKTRLWRTELYIPIREAHMMSFGILPECDRLKIPNLKVGTTVEVYAIIDILDNTRKASTKLRDVNRLLVRKWEAHCIYGFSDIIALAALMIRGRNTTIVRVPTPTEYCSSLLFQKECFVVFHNRLKAYKATRSSEQAD